MAYHPQTDETTEQVNQEFTHNNQRHADRQNTPFELMFGESPVAIPLSFESTKYQQ